MINLAIRFVFTLPIMVVMMVTIAVNVRLHTAVVNPKEDLILELRGLKHLLDKNADMEMQKLYPEGYLFFNALYGLSWCNYVTYFNDIDSTGVAHKEIQRAVDNIFSENCRAVFDRDLPIPYGAFYSGWSAYLLGKKLAVEHPDERSAKEIQRFKQQCDEIAKGISISTFPASYSGKAWPADATLCIASLVLYDRLFPPKYHQVIQGWILQVKQHLDDDGLIPHEVVPATGKVVEGARGSSQSLMLAFLPDVDDKLSRDQFISFKEKFLDSRFGLTGIREYPFGRHGLGDVDSGPVILQIGASATIAGLYPISHYGDAAAEKMYREIEALGFTRCEGKEKNYLLGVMPMADAFITWSHSTSARLTKSNPTFSVFHLFSIGLCLLCGVVLWAFWGCKQKSTLNIPW